MTTLKLVALIAFIAVVTSGAPSSTSSSKARTEIDEWWKTAVFYQIYPRSFKDDNNDGSGDLKGITNKLEYLKDLGITGTWLSPIFKSPMADAGYDISDFRDINPIFGNMEDFDQLLAEATRLGIKLILDFVPNHSSDEHDWFKKSVKKQDPYTNYYVWADAKIVDEQHQPPNNWKSLFLGSAWEWNEEREQYYLHQFSVKQPDLNYRCPELVNEMKEILRFWLTKGIAGFRVDAVPFLFENTSLLDEPKYDSNKPDNETEYVDLKHIYTMDQNETFDMIYQWRDVLDEFSEKDGISRVMMTEAYTTIENTIKYYGNETHNGASFTFNFFLLVNLNSESNAEDFVQAIQLWTSHIPKRFTSNWVLGNHDNHRTATRHNSGRIDGLNMLTMMLPGVGVTYNGEEIGMEDGYVSWKDTEDPNACNAGPDHYQEYSRDPERTPFQWDDTTNAGFNTGTKTWLPVSDKYIGTNVKAQNKAESSHLKIYKQLMELRKTETIQKGDYDVFTYEKDVFILVRSYEQTKYILVFNVANVKTNVAFNSDKLPDEMSVEISSINSPHKKGEKFNKNQEITLHGYEALVLKA